MMERVLEHELMEDITQVNAYANANFNKSHSLFARRLKAFIKNPDFDGNALDIGCGPGDISFRFAKAFPKANLDALDGSKPMLDMAANLIHPDLKGRVNFVHGSIPGARLPKASYDIIFSNSLLHHLPDPSVLWQTIKEYSTSGTRVVVMDLIRPHRPFMATSLVQMYTISEPKILQQDFYNSLLAAFTIDEIKIQLAVAGLPFFNVDKVDDHHVMIMGMID